MKGTIVQDVIILVGVIFIVFASIFWALTFGVKVVENLMYSAPEVVQDSLASFISMGCVFPGNFTASVRISNIDTASIELSASGGDYSINLIPSSGRSYKGGVDRGGYVLLKTPPPDEFVLCDGIVFDTNPKRFDSRVHGFLDVVKRGNELGVFSR